MSNRPCRDSGARTKPWRFKHCWASVAGSNGLWTGLDALAMLNQHLPSWVLHSYAPLQAYPSAAHSGRSYCPEWEAKMLDLDTSLSIWRAVAGFGTCERTGGSTLGDMTTISLPAFRSHLLELRFDANQGCFLGQPAGSETTITIAPQGLTKTDLMGELGHLLALPAYQLALPFTHGAWRQLEYTRVLAGTTS